MKPYWGNSGQTCMQRAEGHSSSLGHIPLLSDSLLGAQDRHLWALLRSSRWDRANQQSRADSAQGSCADQGVGGGGGTAKLCWRIIRSLLSPLYKTATQRKLGIAVLLRQNCSWQSKGHKSEASRMCVSACLCVCVRAGVCVCVCPHLHGCVHSYACMYTTVF